MQLDDLDRKAAERFEGYLVRKDLVRQFSRQFPVPTPAGHRPGRQLRGGRGAPAAHRPSVRAAAYSDLANQPRLRTGWASVP